MKTNPTIKQLFKFGIVGISNTLITAIVIWGLLKTLHFSDYTSNIIGYIAGLINSFIWNRLWTFKSKTRVSITFYKFIITFAISYAVQLGNLYLLLNFTTIDPYLCQLLSIVVYTIINFILNKFYTFKS
ncbi:MAG: GtrA family protein [Paludibacter sp.]|nr:GtrA family protein [Paludibacter sp.]MDD4197947.1 GtrA family protein [Paludibacter sp.]MDD4427238.1 GtrA family protein [Paludibacter sp.]